ncbi:MAG: hypothetical protein JO157_17920, partial [Acetobacteraceae bacterium]|nr:hypothetical protein [Acetobacteraceae bacterium]
MGELILLADRFADRSRPGAGGDVAFFFDVTSPFSYLAAERIERMLGEVEWIPCAQVRAPHPGACAEAEREALAQ